MSRFHEYNNEFDQDDDGEDLEISDEEEAASDDEGREQAALLMAHCESVVGNRKVHEDQRRMWFRMAKRALADGAERREAAEEQERAEREVEEAAERARVKAERAAKHDRELIEREDRDAAIRRQNAESARIEAEAAWMVAQARPVARREMLAPPPPVATIGPRWVEAPSQRPSATPAPSTPAAAAPSWPGLGGVPTARPSSPASGHRPPLTSVARLASPGPCQAAPPRPLPAVPSPRPTVVPTTPAILRSPSRTVPTLMGSPTAPPPTPVTAPVPTPAVPPAQEPPPFTGADLAAYRRTTGFTQALFAQHLGVTQGTVSKAECVPRAVLGPALRLALWGRKRG